jgi:hypothetical protein
MISLAYSLPTRAELKDYAVLADNQAIRVFGDTVLGDMSSEIWIYKTSSMAVENGTTVIKPTDIPVSNPGRFILFEKMKRIETYQGTTIATAGSTQGTFSVVYPKPFLQIPNVQPSFVSTDPKESFTLTSSTTTGFTVKIQLRSDVIGLLPTYSNVVNRAVNVLVTEVN